MKFSRLGATLILLGTLTLGMADVSIDAQIAAIGAASPEDRVTLVNELKETLATFSSEERAEAIAQLRANMSVDGEQLQTQTKAGTRTKSRVDQMEQTEDMQRMQQMKQQQAGSQAKQQGMIGAGAGLGLAGGNQNAAAGQEKGTTPNGFMGRK